MLPHYHRINTLLPQRNLMYYTIYSYYCGKCGNKYLYTYECNKNILKIEKVKIVHFNIGLSFKFITTFKKLIQKLVLYKHSSVVMQKLLSLKLPHFRSISRRGIYDRN